MPDKVTVGIVGLGLVSTSHLKGYNSHPKSEVVAVCDTDENRARNFAETHGIPQYFTSYEEMIDTADISAVDIAVPTFLHAPIAIRAAQASKHVYCEKPFCRFLGEGMEAVDAAQRSGTLLTVGETYVFNTSHIRARQLIDDGEIGQPLQIRHRHGAWNAREDPAIPTGAPDRSWRVDAERSGGGAYPWIFDHAVHFFAATEYFAKDQPIAEVYAIEASRGQGQIQSGAPHDPYATAETDIPIVTWKFEDSSVQGLWMRAEPLNGKYDYMHGFSTTIVGETGLIEVLGEGGHNLLWNGQQQHLVLHRQGRETTTFRFDEGGDDIWQSSISYYSQGHINQTHHFVDSILGDDQLRYTGEDGLRAVRNTLAAVRSVRESRPVNTDEIEPAYTAY